MTKQFGGTGRYSTFDGILIYVPSKEEERAEIDNPREQRGKFVQSKKHGKTLYIPQKIARKG